MTLSGQRQRCEGDGRVQLRVCNGDSVVVDVYVVEFKPLGFEFILGIKGISALGGVTTFPSLATSFGSSKTDDTPVCVGATKVEKPVCAGATKVEKPVCAGATKVEKSVYAGATKVEKSVYAGATKVEKPVCAGGDAIEIDEPGFCVSFDGS